MVLAPLTRGGNLPYRRLCVEMGASVTFSEMAHALSCKRRERRELALLRHHPDEPLFGVQIAARDPDIAVAGARVALEQGASFIDINLGCPINSVVSRGMGAALLERPRRLERLFRPLREACGDVALFAKIRSGYRQGQENALEVMRVLVDCGVDALSLHGRTRDQRYRRAADWTLVAELAAAAPIPVIGNGDILHASEARARLRDSGCTAVMAARGALIKPWLWQDLGETEDRPRSAAERLEVYRRWVAFALEHWGDDEHGFLRIRPFLEFHVDWWRRYIPEDAELDGENAMQSRTSFEPRDEGETLLAAADDETLHRACNVILEPFAPPPSALEPSPIARDSSAGGWS